MKQGPTKRKRTEGEAPDEEKPEEEKSSAGASSSEQQSGGVGSESVLESWKSDTSSLLLWRKLLAENPDCVDEDSLLRNGMNANGWAEDCDMQVPLPNLLPVIQQVAALLADKDDVWQLVHQPSSYNQEEEQGRHPIVEGIFAYRSQKGARLMFRSAGASFVALEHKKERAGEDDISVVVGQAGGHPFIHSQLFEYSNSDGSSSEGFMPRRITAHSVLIMLLERLWHHADDMDH
ncbi:hypothetical protein QOT17_008191 [Balamuthia mandrillaris]